MRQSEASEYVSKRSWFGTRELGLRRIGHLSDNRLQSVAEDSR
jgi:hypothetical protein